MSVATAARRILAVAGFGVLPLVLLAAFLHAPNLGYDFRALWNAAEAIRQAHDPYPVVNAIPASPKALDVFAYPPPVAFVVLPLTLLPFAIVAFGIGVADAAAAVLAVRILGVRDWRCYGVVIGSLPTLGSVRLGTLSPFLALLLAVAWKARATRSTAAVAGGSAIVAKLFLWPLLIWLVASRRTATAALTAVGCSAVILAAWGAIAFDGFGRYPNVLERVTQVQYAKSFSLLALLQAAGAQQGPAQICVCAVGIALLAAIWAAGRSSRDELAFSLAILASLVLTPLLWLHYFVLLELPIALRWPRLSWAWFALVAFWSVPWEEAGGRIWAIVVALGIATGSALAPAGGQCLRRGLDQLAAAPL